MKDYSNSIKDEFPDFELNVTIPEGFKDTSWENEELQLKLWIDYDNKEDRECHNIVYNI